MSTDNRAGVRPASAGLAVLSLLVGACTPDAGLERLVVAPDVRIVSPAPGARIDRADGRITVQGEVGDDFDGASGLDVWVVIDGDEATTVHADDDGAVAWPLDVADLAVGPHTLTLGAVDSHDATAADSVRFELYGGGAPEAPIAPARVGDLVITELFADPTAAPDEQGEFVELVSVSDHAIALSGFDLRDDGIDATELRTSLVVAPGAYVVLCASVDAGANGGVPCDAAFEWSWNGGGFALANSGDEVVLTDPGGVVIDRVTYAGSQVIPGKSLGVRPTATHHLTNDLATHWCTQVSVTTSGGDASTPGLPNDPC